MTTAAPSLARSARAMTLWTAISRASGFVRIAVVTNILGITYLANTYQTANTIPNILFELFAAGALQAVLVPAMVDLLDGDDPDEASHVVGAVLGVTCAALAAAAVVGAALAPTLMRLMVRDVPDAAIRAQEVRLGTFMLWFFLPQVVLYAANAVATAVLNATGTFAVPVAAPTINNVVVIGVYITFAVMRGGAPPSLDVTTAQKVVLAGGTTLAVVAFCALPIAVAARRIRFRPNFDVRHPRLRGLARAGGWAIAYLALTQALLVVILQLTNRREGAVAVYQLAYVVFLLPHSLFAVPVLTTRFPSLSRLHLAGDHEGFAANLAEGVRSISFVALGSTALLVGLAGPGIELVVHGRTRSSAPEIARAAAGFAPGLVGLGLFWLLTRACYALGDSRSPTLANLAGAVVGSIAMVTVAGQVAARDLVAALGLAYAGAQTVSAVVLWLVVRRALRRDGTGLHRVVVPGVRNVAAAVAAGSVAYGFARLIGAHRPFVVTAVATASAAAVAAAVYVVGQAALGGPAPRAALTTMGAALRGGPTTDGDTPAPAGTPRT